MESGMATLGASSSSRILMVQPCHVNFGGHIRSANLARILRDKGLVVDHICSAADKRYSSMHSGDGTDYFLPRFTINHFITGRLFRAFWIVFYLIFNHRKYGAIHFFNICQLECLVPVVLLRALINRKIVVDWDDYWSAADEVTATYSNNGVLSYLRRVEAWSAQTFDRITVASDFLHGKVGPDTASEIIINAVDHDTVRSADRNLENGSAAPRIISIGNTMFAERSVYLDRFMQGLLKYNKEAKLVTNVALEEFKAQLGKHGRHNRFEYYDCVGYIDGVLLEELEPGISASAFFMSNSMTEKACSPTRIMTLRKLGAPLVTMESDTLTFRTLRKVDCVISAQTPEEAANLFWDRFNGNDWLQFRQTSSQSWNAYPSWQQMGDKLLTFYQKHIKNFRYAEAQPVVNRSE